MNFDQLSDLLRQKRYLEFMRKLDEINVVDAAEFLNYVDPEILPKVFRLLKKATAAEIFPELDPELQETIIQASTDTEISKLIDELFIDDTIDMLEELPASVVSRVLKASSPLTRAEINKFLNYPPQSVGGVMTSEFLSIYANMTVSEAIERVRRIGYEKETIYVIYVTDSSRVLRGFVELRDLIFSAKDEIIENIMDTSIVSAQTLDDKEIAASLISKYDLLALPAVDTEGRLVGIVTVDDALDVIEEEATEDIEIMAAISPTDKPYLRTGVFETWRKRIPWLMLLLISAMFTGSIITHYETALGSMVALTAFIPMLMGTGGNAGGQASATIIRGLSLGDIKMGDILKIIWKELRISLLCGVTLSLFIFAKAMLIDNTSSAVALVVSVSLLLTVIIAKLVGCSLPILAKRVGFDPAVMASPFITTIVDAVSLLIYFQIASYTLGI